MIQFHKHIFEMGETTNQIISDLKFWDGLKHGE